MLPVLTFASGLLAGIVGIRLLKKVKAPASLDGIGDSARHGLDKAQTGLRQATVSSLTAIEKTSASLRSKLTPDAPEAAPEAEVSVQAEKPAKAKPARKPAARKPRKTATPPVPETGAGS